MKHEPMTTPDTLDMTRRYHFVGIGGISMSGIAQVLLTRGYRVSGSDAKSSPILERLAALGAQVFVGHDAAHLTREDTLVISDAIKQDNPEWAQARAWGLPMYKRADLLGYLVNSGRGVAVSGTHGKSTTSGMLSLIFLEAGMDPTCLLGGELAPLGGTIRLGSPLTVVEACEAYNSFLNLAPDAALIMNIEVDHLDYHGTPAHLYDSFRQFLCQVRGLAVVNGDDVLLAEMAGLAPRAVTYGAHPARDYQFTDVALGAEPSFTLLHHGEALGRITLRVPGLHNISNAAGAAALALEFGADFTAVQRGLAAFPGIHRRFERIGHFGAAAVVDDYAHHPTEICATLAATRASFPGRIVTIFQPHLYSRTRDLLHEFAGAFGDADLVVIAPIYAARELPIDGVSHVMLQTRMGEIAPDVPVITVESLAEAVRLFIQTPDAAAEVRHADAIPDFDNGDVIITLGAGDVDSVAHALANAGAPRP